MADLAAARATVVCLERELLDALSALRDDAAKKVSRVKPRQIYSDV
jgi:hypothetical protein